jgi:hypothetical protein
MNEKRIKIKEKLNIIYNAIGISFIFLILILLICLFLKFNLNVSGSGTVVQSIEVQVESEYEGDVSGIYVKDGEHVFAGEEIYTLKNNLGEKIFVFAPKDGQFITMGSEVANINDHVKKGQMLGVVLSDGVFFKAEINERDVPDVKENQTCFIRIWAFEGDSYQPLGGKVFFISDFPDYGDQKTFYSVFCVFDENQSSVKNLKLGMGGKAKIMIGKYTLFDSIFGIRDREVH